MHLSSRQAKGPTDRWRAHGSSAPLNRQTIASLRRIRGEGVKEGIDPAYTPGAARSRVSVVVPGTGVADAVREQFCPLPEAGEEQEAGLASTDSSRQDDSRLD